MLNVAVVGSGPAGLYTAEALVKQAPALGVEVQVDVLDRLPTPYGLVRYGVAPDHKSIKSIAEYLRKVLESPDVRFVGGVHLGDDVTREDLLGAYDAVVYATGAMRDRRLGIPGEDLPGSFAATDFVNWYCGHPDIEMSAFTLDAESVAVIGVGNVAVDVARILARDPASLAATDVPQPVLEALHASKVREVHMIGRRGPAHAKFTTKELRELGELPGVDVVVYAHEADLKAFDLAGEGLALAESDRRVRGNMVAINGWASGQEQGAARRLTVRFWLRPTAILGDERVTGLTLERTRLAADGSFTGTGEFETLDAQMVLRSVGYQSVPLPGVPFDSRACVVPNVAGRVTDPATGDHLPGEYVAGWLKRGPTGVIGTNKSDAAETVRSLFEDLGVETASVPRAGMLQHRPADGAPEGESPLAGVLAARGITPVSYQEWMRIETAERDLAKALGRGDRVKLPGRDAIWSVCRPLQVLASGRRWYRAGHAVAGAQRVQFGERGGVVNGSAQPGSRLAGAERANLDLGQAPAGADHGGVQSVQVLVGGDGDQHVPALAEHPVSQVEQAGQGLTGGLLGLAPDQFVAVLEHQQPPLGRLVVIIVAAHGHVHQVAGTAEQDLGIQHAVRLAPRLPLARERAQQRGLPRPRCAVQQDQPSGGRLRRNRQQAGQRARRRDRIVGLDVHPRGGGDPAAGPVRAVRGLMPEPDADRAIVGLPFGGGVLGGRFQRRSGQGLAGRGNGDVGTARPPAHALDRPSVSGGEQRRLAHRVGGAPAHGRAWRQQARLGPHLVQVHRA
jgi:ferredoxin--NADP+ reductase